MEEVSRREIADPNICDRTNSSSRNFYSLDISCYEDSQYKYTILDDALRKNLKRVNEPTHCRLQFYVKDDIDIDVEVSYRSPSHKNLPGLQTPK